MVMRQFQQQFENYGMRLQPSSVVEHLPPTGRSGKGSCSTAGVPRDDMDDTHPCQLYIISLTGTILVARDIVYEAVHGMKLGEDEVKVTVTVDEVIVPYAFVPVPIEEFGTMAQTFKCFAA
ncbi:hypothetical protein LR48_Vigan07g089700 [Vigna angularis]|uniref:DUF8039 domain-containing protein n=1 Tax=Phaseolus angularis TaxID=3914 RepID=A0A0L9UWP1_PHAAN|nr:hypothetical protein LR48_Vigan07g089700 [Vigna angularis]